MRNEHPNPRAALAPVSVSNEPHPFQTLFSSVLFFFKGAIVNICRMKPLHVFHSKVTKQQ